MGEEGFSSDSSLLYHRGVPSAIVASEVWELPDQTRTPNHPLKPRHLRLHDLETGTDAVTGPAAGARQQRRPDRLRRHRRRPLAVLPQRDRRRVRLRRGRRRARSRRCSACSPTGTGDYVVVPRATTHRWVPAEPSRLYADRGQQPRRAAQALPVPLRPAARARAVLRARPARSGRAAARRGRRTSRCWSSTAPAPASSAPG